MEALLAASLTTAVMIPQPGKKCGHKDDKKKEDKKEVKRDEKKEDKKDGKKALPASSSAARAASPNVQYCTSFVSAPRPQSAARDFEEQGRLADNNDKDAESPGRAAQDTKDLLATPGAHPTQSAEDIVSVAPAGPSSDLLTKDTKDDQKEVPSQPLRVEMSSLTPSGMSAAPGTRTPAASPSMHTGPGWSYASAARSREYPAHPLPDKLSDEDLLMPVGTDAASLMKCTFLKSGPAPLEYPSRLTYVPTGPVHPGLPKSPTWCLSCPPNSLGFSTAWAVKKDVPEPKVRRGTWKQRDLQVLIKPSSRMCTSQCNKYCNIVARILRENNLKLQCYTFGISGGPTLCVLHKGTKVQRVGEGTITAYSAIVKLIYNP